MKARNELLEGDGFDKNVAEKMPKMKKLEQSFQPTIEKDQSLEKESQEKPTQEHVERKPIEPPKNEAYLEHHGEIKGLIEDLHGQLLAYAQTKRALEMDLQSREKTIHQLSQDNQNLRHEMEGLNEELKRLREIQTEWIYLKEENIDALERIQKYQQELKALKEALEETTKQRDEALLRIKELESKLEGEELLKIKGKLKERELSYLSEENQRLQSALDEAISRNIDLEEKYNTLKRSFNEVKESLTLLRDSCKKDYYNLTENP